MKITGDVLSAGASLTLIRERFYLDFAGENSIDNLQRNTQIAFDRQDISVTLGYGIYDNVSLFTGFKQGKTKIYSQSGVPDNIINLQEYGPYIGAGAGWRASENNIFSFTVAYADMQSKYQDATINSARGDVSGTSLAIAWRWNMNKHLFSQLSMVRHDYFYENFDQINFDIHEKLLSIRASLAYQF
ncbi:hypothetical protein QUF61_08245 [Candidatus Venteria ishoeyi]|uniref:hypothetical protein n=1 Tax=Candidatus Venteria ishoeyi TaxID=1899563 RepID=UPI0025A682C3|nr:hypothetical protein [Candidatus Venteria ishoeyi]MDM8546471.1 hypothetical protein [Candidatus Venteria ishoeyi]